LGYPDREHDFTYEPSFAMSSADTPGRSMRLENRVVFVTGASSGLGARFAITCAAAGAQVVLAARRIARLEALEAGIRAAGGHAASVMLDVNDHATIDAAVRQAESAFGPIDVLVNNSGVSVTGKLVDATADDYDHIMNTNLRGSFFVAQAIARRMIARAADDGGVCSKRIVNIASVTGLKPLSQVGLYSMSKAAIIHMTKSMALEWGRYGINVNAVCPGYVSTEINQAHWQTEGGRKLIGTLPRRRVGQVADLDGIMLLLASRESDFINGSVITVDDGHAVS
jgi:NAD(P)-dependent dehydrogenase (short-subunit alcohol dehydrogenase family)